MGIHFLKNEWSKPAISRKVFIAQINILSFTWKLEFWKTYIHHCELDSFQIPKDFSAEISSNTNKCDISFSVKKCVKILKSCITQWANIFPKDKYATKSCIGKRPIQVQDRRTDSNIKEHKFFDIWFQMPHFNSPLRNYHLLSWPFV